MPNNLVATIIPIYKPQLNANELLSLQQCLRILKKYPIIFIGPKELNTTIYQEVCQDSIPFKLQAFDDSYFNGIAGYNKLMLSTGFYKTFLAYKYILIYQLDAYVFKDELTYWCNQNYDFIGAPHPSHENLPQQMQFLKGYAKLIQIANKIFNTHHTISNVGNGGFSLRKTRTCYWLLMFLKSKAAAWKPYNEDGFFKYWGNLLYPLFRLPTDGTALKFSIEQTPAQSLKKLNGELPFGCHAFEKYEAGTWQSIINPK